MTGFTGERPPETLNLARYCLADSARQFPDKTALTIYDGQKASYLTYAEIEDIVLRIAASFNLLGLEKSARVFIRMSNSFDYAAVFWGANAAGLVPVATSSMLTAQEAGYLLSDSGAQAIVYDDNVDLPDIPDGCIRIGSDDLAAFKRALPGTYAVTTSKSPAYLIYTSGTAGTPKGVLHAQRAVWGRRPMYEGWYGITSDDVVLHTGAFNWTYTLGTGLFDPLANGASSIIYTGPKDRGVWLKLIEEFKPTIMASVPAIYRQLLHHADLKPCKLSSLRHCLSAGEALHPEIMQGWTDATGLAIYEALGMSEISTYISNCPGLPIKPGSSGKPQPGRSVAILPVEGGEEPLLPGETGLIAVHRSDPGLMLGYWQRPEEDEKVYRGDWFVGGDIGHFDDDGYLWYEGRDDDVMTSLGYRISPTEVEQVLMRHPQVVQAGVTEVEVNPGMKLITAFIVPKEHASLKSSDLIDFASQSLARYKIPKQVFFVDHLTTTANGKIVRKTLPSLLKETLDHANDR